MRTLVSMLLLATPVAVPAAPAVAADTPVVLRGVVLSTRNATTTPTTCSTATRVGVYWTDPGRRGVPAGSGIAVTNARTGAVAPVASSVTAWRNGVSSVTYRLRLCGFGAGSGKPVTEPGWYRVAVRGAGPATTGFTVRYQGVVHLHPVRRGGTVTLRASVSDGWEYSDTHPVRWYFRRTGTTTWQYRGRTTPRCVDLCDIGEAHHAAVRRFAQPVPGMWKAVSQRTAYLESGSRTASS